MADKRFMIRLLLLLYSVHIECTVRIKNSENHSNQLTKCLTKNLNNI
jgi:hypothetical protein